MKTRNIFLIRLLAILSMALVSSLYPCFEAGAAKVALLVGVSKYPYLDANAQLEGPANDVAALRQILIKTQGFLPENVHTLINSQAAKSQILNRLKDLIQTTHPGDFVLVYFSGHGTSSYDPKTKTLAMSPYTGAIVPGDFKMGTPDEMRERLIIGTRDLKPLFLELEKERIILAVFDACYSGFTVRGLKDFSLLKMRNLPLAWEELTDDEPAQYGANTAKAPEYPYQNLVYLSAASAREQAVDITAGAVAAGEKTLDGLAHGAFTNSFLAGLLGGGDLNKNGSITIRELYQYTREKVSSNFRHTPGLLVSPDQKFLADKSMFSGSPAQESAAGPLRVLLENLDPELTDRISRIDGVQVVNGPHDLMVTRDTGMFRIFLGSGYPLTGLEQSNPKVLEQYLIRRVQIKKLKDLSNPHQNFNVFLDLIGEKGILPEGSVVGFRITTEKRGFVLFLDMDSAGNVYVLYPFTQEEMAPLPAGRSLELKELGQVVPPFGAEHLKLFVFPEKPPFLRGLMGGEMDPSDRRLQPLFDLGRHGQDVDFAQATLQVKTCAAKDVVRGVQ